MDLDIYNKIEDRLRYYEALGINSTHIVLNPYTCNKLLNTI
jgi:hypothetical protein